MRFDPETFYKSVYEYVNFHIGKYETVIPIPSQKALKTLSVYPVLLTQDTLKQIHQKNLYLDLGIQDDKVLAVLKACVDAAENRLPQYLSRKTIDRTWNSIKAAYGGKHRLPDAEIFDETVLFVDTDTSEADSH